MILVLIRHADASVPDANRWPDDNDRPLTKYGREAQRRMCEYLQAEGFVIDHVVTSPALRAEQTAKIVSGAFGVPKPLPCPGIVMKPTLPRLRKCLRDVRPSHAVAIVSHSGWLEPIASLLLSGSPAMHIDFPKSAALVIRAPEIEPGAGTLVAFLRPTVDP